jgi:hypothetical protein
MTEKGASLLNLFQVAGGKAKRLPVCGRCWVVVAAVVAVGLREDWEEDSGGCRCVRPEEERSHCGAGLLCQWAAALVWLRDGGGG